MSQTLEKRVEDLEEKFSELNGKLLEFGQRKKVWRSTFGTLEDDEIAREAELLGHEYRKQQTYENEIAGS